MSKSHPMAQHTERFGISPKLQEIICLLGQGYVFEEGEDLLAEILNIAISAKQIQRVSEHYGQAIEEQQEQFVKEQAPVPVIDIKKASDPLYMMMDGSMVYTREDEWKEMKVGRMFAGGDCIPLQENRNQITQSLYVCHLGDHKSFFAKWEAYTQGYSNKVCIADGAKWLWNWVEDTCPETVQILDFFHAVEKIGSYASVQYPDKNERKRWLDIQKQKLLNDEVTTIIATLQNTVPQSKEAEKLCKDAIRYYQNNKCRMKYKTYLAKGYLIGSGAIESAHRNVVQQRLKLSGQRWSIKGAQQIVNLRAYKKSNLWTEVVQLIKNAA